MRLLITGTPGIGKTLICQKLSRKLNIIYINLSKVLIESDVVKFNEKFKTYEILNFEKAKEITYRELSKYDNFICETIAVELFEDFSYIIDKVIVLRMNPILLLKRMLNLSWPKEKIHDNILSEILDYFLIKSIEIFGKDKIIEINVTKKNVENVINEILNYLQNRKNCIGIVDWIEEIYNKCPNIDVLQSIERYEFDKLISLCRID